MAQRVVTECDVVIVGAGSAGSVLASRLSEDPARTVVVLEAGLDWRADEFPSDLRNIPNRPSGETFRSQPDFYWPELNCLRFSDDEPRTYLRGRGVGGSSNVNGCHAVRPPLVEFDDWVALGCAGWGPDEVLPYFIKLEDDREYGSAPYHGIGGPMPITRHVAEHWGAVDCAFRDATIDAGHRWQPDHNAPNAQGISPFAVNVVDGKRVTTNDAYLLPVRDRPNLSVVSGVMVDRVLVDRGRAVGVQTQLEGETVEFRSELILLCGGAVMSPAILQRSGIGRPKLLGDIGIPIVVNLPTGESMQDHASVSLRLPLRNGVAHDTRGINALVRWSSERPGSGFNDLYVCLQNASGSGAAAGPPAMLGILRQVFSRGLVSIESNDPGESPRMVQNLLDDELDQLRMRDIFDAMLTFVAESPLKAIVESVQDSSGTAVDPAISGAELDAWNRANVRSTSAISGTCRMGSVDDQTTVVDTSCRVLGLDGLRVVDASVFPTNPRANIHLTVLMVAERLADLLRAAGPSAGSPGA